MWINPIHHRNMVMIASGFGDGFYQSYIGYDENEEVCQIIVPMVNPDLRRQHRIWYGHALRHRSGIWGSGGNGGAAWLYDEKACGGGTASDAVLSAEKITGKKCPPFQPLCMQTFVRKSFAAPMTINCVDAGGCGSGVGSPCFFS